MQNYFVLSRFFYSSYKPFGYNLVLFRKKKETTTTIIIIIIIIIIWISH